MSNYLDRFWWSIVVYGKVTRIDDNIIKSMIDLEEHFWKGIKPDALFLLERNNSLKANENSITWLKLKKEYTILSNEEESKYPIFRIQNDKSFEESLDKIIVKITDTIQNERQT